MEIVLYCKTLLIGFAFRTLRRLKKNYIKPVDVLKFRSSSGDGRRDGWAEHMVDKVILVIEYRYKFWVQVENFFLLQMYVLLCFST